MALPVHQRVAQGEVLGHPHHRVVNGRVAAEVVLPHHLADARCALAVASIGGQPQVRVHGVQNAPLHRLEAIADIRQGAAHDDGQRIALSGRFLQGYGLDDGHWGMLYRALEGCGAAFRRVLGGVWRKKGDVECTMRTYR